jgi:hypothetical protein
VTSLSVSKDALNVQIEATDKSALIDWSGLTAVKEEVTEEIGVTPETRPVVSVLSRLPRDTEANKLPVGKTASVATMIEKCARVASDATGWKRRPLVAEAEHLTKVQRQVVSTSLWSR